MQPITSDSDTLEIFRQALTALNESGVPYVVGGAFAVYHYTTAWRNTRDLDVYVEPDIAPQAAEILRKVGYEDYGEMAEGDRDWIYHAIKDGAIVDVIWEPPNRLQPVDSSFYDRGDDDVLLGVPVCFIPIDELILAKLFTLNHDRTDWPDIFRLVQMRSSDIDWERLLYKVGEHWEILLAFIVIYDWAYPSEMRKIPTEIRCELLQRKIDLPIDSNKPTREAILDPWIYTRPSG